MAHTRLTRETLYNLVWTQPVTQLAPQLGLSDVGLAKICQRLDIPRPGRGYWIKKQFGKAPAQKALPDAKPGIPSEAELPDPPAVSPTLKPRTEPPEIRVSPALRSPHPLIRKTLAGITKAGLDDYGLTCARRAELLDIRVSPSQTKRALRIMDALLKALKQRGHDVEINASYREKPTTRMLIGNQAIRFMIREKVNRTERAPAHAAGKRNELYGALGRRRFDITPTGKLYLEIDEYTSAPCRKRWSDTASRRLEELLGEFIIGAEAIAEDGRISSLEREAEMQAAEARRAKKAEEAERERAEAERVEQLCQMAGRWRKAQEIKCFLDAYEAATPNDHELSTWIAWGREVARSLDPTSRKSHGNELDQ